MCLFLDETGGNPGRSGHRLSISAGRVVYETREALATLFHVADPLRIVFTHNATHAINQVLLGVLKPGDTLVTSGVEHNAVMRPARALERAGVRVIVAACASDGSLDADSLRRSLANGARLVAVTHASNVTGAILPVVEVVRIAHDAGALVLVDAAQTAGSIPIDIQALDADLLAFTGHKGLLGPPGTGGLVIGERFNPSLMEPLVRGGTGSRSESEEQPDFLPDRYESGTPNGVGIAGLGAGVRWVMQEGLESIRAREVALTQLLLDGLADIPGVTVHSPADASRRAAVVSFTVRDRQVSELGMRLDDEFGVLCRVGLHCAPAAHRTIGTYPEGTVRFSLGPYSTREHILTALEAVEHIVRG
jgi:cysteine desulfurase family protein